MGTNYYLQKKANYTPRKDKGDGGYNDYDFEFFENRSNNVLELTNGFVFANTYYPSIEELNEVYYLTYHIGKSSYGWRFLLQVYPQLNINSLEDWKKLLSEGTIFDEYGDKISKEEMLEIITKKEPSPRLKDETSITMYNEKHEIRDGLIVHPLKRNIVDNSAKETYDLCKGNFS